MAHALLGISRPSKRLAAPSVSNSQTDDDGLSSLASNNNSLSLRHQHSIASTSSTLYTCSEEDEHSCGEGGATAVVADLAACDEVIQDSRLNGAGLPIPWHSHSIEASTSSSTSNKSKERAANHAMRFKRKSGSSRASLMTLGQDWHPRTASGSTDAALYQSPSKESSQSSSSASGSPRTMSRSTCTCNAQMVSPRAMESSTLAEDEAAEGGDISMDDQLDKMIRMTSDLLRISKGVLASSKRVSVTKASESQIQHSHEHALRQHLESLETQDRFMHYISNEAHTILTSTEDVYSPLSSLHSQLHHSHVSPPPVSRGRLRPHSSNGSISAPVIRATTMYVNAEMGNGISGPSISANRERHASVASHATGGSSLGSVKEEGEVLMGDDAGQDTSTPAHVSKAVSRKPSHLSDVSISSSNGMLQASNSQPNTQSQYASSRLSAPDVSSTVLSPTLSSMTTNSSTPSSSTFFSSFWSRSSATTNASSNMSTTSSPNTTLDSPSLSRFLPRKGTPAQFVDQQNLKKDAKGMLSALAASSPPLPPPSEAETTFSRSKLDSPPSAPVAPLSPTDTTSSLNASASSSQGQPFEARSPPMASSTSTAAMAQLSAVHSSPHLTVSSRPRHRASLSESLLRASWSGSNLKSEVVNASSGQQGKSVPHEGDANGPSKGHRRTRHSTSPAAQFAVQVSNVPVNHKTERSGRERD